MSKICQNHIVKPVKIYSQCVGCELEWLQAKVNQLRGENERLRTALEFYKDSRKYLISEKYSGGEFIGAWAEICGDSGNVARQALKEGKHG